MTTDLDKLRGVVQDQLQLSRRLRARVAELEAAPHAPLAVVGMAMRLPGGVTDHEAFLRLLTDADGPVEVITEIPDDRPSLRAVHHPEQGRPGSSYVDRAAFLSDIASFDAAFWGMSAREAESLDPQQRLLLETAWEALEDAGIPVQRGQRLAAGVFVGMMASEYSRRLVADGDLTRIDPYFSTGGGFSFAAGRISWALGLSGPAVTLDTACSSSLVALDRACRSLRAGECEVALVGGANLVLGADLMVSLSQTGALAPDGRSKTFCADADGYGRGEGVATIAVMRLADAQAQGRPVWAVVRGTAVNHDGASSGLTVPSGPAQQEVIRAALADGGVAAAEVGYVETHGTGTSLGDPVEVTALDAVLGSGAPDRTGPLRLGSVKSRIGHLEAAAGVAAVIKAALVLRTGTVPAALRSADARLNPLIPWDDLAVRVPARTETWDSADRVAGVSAFGLSGTNAHVVLQAHEPQPVRGDDDAVQLLTLSARSPAALRVLALTTDAALAGCAPGELSALLHTLRAGRGHHRHRIAVVSAGTAGLRAALRTALDGLAADGTEPAGSRTVLVRSTGDAVAIAEALRGATTGLPRAAAAAEGGATALLAALGVTAHPTGRGGGLVELEHDGRTLTLVDSADAGPGDRARTLLTAVAGLYLNGLDLAWGVLARDGDVFVHGAPGHPMLRRRYWVDEPAAPESPSAVVPLIVQTVVRATDAVDDLADVLLTELGRVLKADPPPPRSSPFTDVGGDSFAAMLLSKSIEVNHGVVVDAEAFPLEGSVGEVVDSLATQIRDALSQRERLSA